MGLEIEQLLKIIIGILVVAAVVGGIYMFFRDKVIDFFKGLSVNDSTKIFLLLIK